MFSTIEEATYYARSLEPSISKEMYKELHRLPSSKRFNVTDIKHNATGKTTRSISWLDSLSRKN